MVFKIPKFNDVIYIQLLNLNVPYSSVTINSELSTITTHLLSSWLRFHEFGMFLSMAPLLGRAATVLNFPPPPPGVIGIPIIPPPPDGFLESVKTREVIS